MNHLEITYDLTKRLEQELDKPINQGNREIIIERVNDLIEQRGIHLDKVTPPFTEKEKVIGDHIVRLNSQIEIRMTALFDELKTEMKQVKSQRQSNRSYTNPYKNVQALDGMFLDSKK